MNGPGVGVLILWWFLLVVLDW